MDRGPFQAKINELVVAANTRRSDGAALPNIIELSLATKDRCRDLLRTAFGSVRFSILTMEWDYYRLGIKKCRRHKFMSKNQYATEAFITFLGYILMSTLTLGFIFPIQRIVASASLDNIGLLYLPHGVTALAFFYFGYRAWFYLLPGQYLEWFLNTYGNDLSLDIVSPAASVSAALVGYTLYRQIAGARMTDNTWISVMILGVAISPLNGLTLSLLNYEGDLLVGIFGYFMGDVLGAFLCLILAVLIQRAVRNIQT